MNQHAERRRAIFERTRTKFLDAGFRFEDDPIFLEWIDRWIAGTMTATELRSRYLRLLHQQEQDRLRRREIR
jgi:hypothetical protein